MGALGKSVRRQQDSRSVPAALGSAGVKRIGADKKKASRGATRLAQSKNSQGDHRMKFNTAALIKICDTEIAARTKAADADFAAAEVEYEKKKAAWLASDHPAALAVAARAVVEKVRKGRIVTQDDLHAFDHTWRSEPSHAFREVKPERKTKGRQPNTDMLEALRDFLVTVSDEEVTSSGLRDVGFRNIAAIIRVAAR